MIKRMLRGVGSNELFGGAMRDNQKIQPHHALIYLISFEPIVLMASLAAGMSDVKASISLVGATGTTNG